MKASIKNSMRPLKLKAFLAAHAITQKAVAKDLQLSPATIAQIVNYGQWPVSIGVAGLQISIRGFLRDCLPEADLSQIFDFDVDDPFATPVTTQIDQPTEDFMLHRKQALSPATRKHFRLARDPFADEALQSHEDVFVSPDIRYVREAMFQTAKHGGFMAVVGESGAGKTTLLRDLEDRIDREGMSIVVIKPYVLAMEDNDSKGKTLKSTHIAEAIMAAVSPLEKRRSSPEARFQQLHKVLRDSHSAGMRHCLVIDEAHSLPIPTIKHLKRFFELEAGFKKLLSIILIGQPELKTKLSEQNHEVREVVQRCEVVELMPLDTELAEFLKFKFERVSKVASEVIDEAGIEALRDRLTLSGRGGNSSRRDTVSLLYPLAVGNLLTAAMNLAADIGAPKVNFDVIRGV